LRSLFLATVPAKKEDPDYAALRGHIPKSLYKRFKMFCLERNVDNSQGLEDLIHEYFEFKDKQEESDRTPDPQPTESEPTAAEPTAAKQTAAKAKGGRGKS
jgi:hypothetical protein